jgi:hypothetical protein
MPKNRITADEPLVLTPDEYYAMSAASEGLCLACGATTAPVEGDARRYPCSACRRTQLFGIEELLVMGVVQVVEP